MQLATIIVWCIFLLIGGYLLFHVVFFLLFEKILFQSTQLEQSYKFKLDVSFDELFIPVQEGIIHGLLLHCHEPRGLILYFHGNKGDLSKWSLVGQELLKHKYDVLMIDYRGYGKSTGARSEKSLYQDAEAVWDYMKDHFNYQKRVVFGRSLGSAIASHLASQRPIDQLILETAMSSLKDTIPVLYRLIAFRSLIRYQLNSMGRINDVSCPIYILHGTTDRVVPFHLGQKLYHAIKQQDKKMIVINNGKHNNLSSFANYQQAMEQILN